MGLKGPRGFGSFFGDNLPRSWILYRIGDIVSVSFVPRNVNVCVMALPQRLRHVPYAAVPWNPWVCLGCNSVLGNSINQSCRRRFKSSHFPGRRYQLVLHPVARLRSSYHLSRLRSDGLEASSLSKLRITSRSDQLSKYLKTLAIFVHRRVLNSGQSS